MGPVCMSERLLARIRCELGVEGPVQVGFDALTVVLSAAWVGATPDVLAGRNGTRMAPEGGMAIATSVGRIGSPLKTSAISEI